jgi:hypothetical protein
MAINFPANPSNGDVHAGFTYNSTKSVWEANSPSMMATSDTAPTSPSDGQMWFDTDGGGTFVYYEDADSSQWVEVIGSQGSPGADGAAGAAGADGGAGVASVYATVNDLPTSGNSQGDMAHVTANNTLYFWNGSGWYKIALINTNPSISGVSSSYTLAKDGTATTVTVTASDPEGLPITYSIASDTSGSIATVTQGTGASSNVFTVTPSTSEANAGTFTLTFRASDGVNIATAPASFTLQFLVLNSNYTTALITSVGANTATNSSFLDSSTSNHTVTTLGNTNQSTFSPYRHGGYSLYFDGATVMDLGFSTLNSGNWTFECWVICEQGETIVGKYSGGNQLEAFGISNTTGYMYTHTGVGVETPTCVTNLKDGQWHYCVWERYNGTYYYWADGSLEASFANSEAPSGGGNWGMGGVASGRFKGYVKEARLSLSTAVYSGNAPTTPTEPQTTSNATDAFFTGVGVEIKDYSSNNRTFTLNTTKLAPRAPYDYVKYNASNNSGSMYFDGTGDYLTIPDHADFDFGTDPFTIEAWINIDTTRGNYDRIVAGGTQADGANNHWFVGFWPGAQINVGYYNGSGYTETQFNIGSMPNELWHHVAIVRNGANIECYFNGVSKGTWNIGASTAWNTGAQGLIVGHRYNNGSPIEPYHGYIGNLRIVKGTAVYTSAFTPPTTALTAISGTSLLLSGTNAGIIDKSQSAKTLTLTADVQSSNLQTNLNTTSILFDGTSDKIEIPNFQLLRDGRDFTIEFWIYLPNTSAERNILETFSFSATSGWTIYHLAGGRLDFYPHHTNLTTLSASTWTHVAIENYGGTIQCFVNGTSTYSATHTNTSTPTAGLRIGTRSGTANYFIGNMEDIRITDGYARYQGTNFTPPTEALKG